VVHEVVTVKPLAADRKKQLAGRDLSRIGGYTGDAAIGHLIDGAAVHCGRDLTEHELDHVRASSNSRARGAPPNTLRCAAGPERPREPAPPGRVSGRRPGHLPASARRRALRSRRLLERAGHLARDLRVVEREALGADDLLA